MIDTMFPSAFSSYKPRCQKVYGCICMSGEGRILLVKGRMSGKWSLPKGHMEAWESDLQCALRELREETQIVPDCQYSSYKKFSAGGYFVFFFKDEPTPSCQGSQEIEEVRWCSVEELDKLKCNVDLNLFKRWLQRSVV